MNKIKEQLFSSDDICKIMEAASKFGVSEFSLNSLKFKIGNTPEPLSQVYQVDEKILEQSDSQAREATRIEERKSVEDDLDLLLLTDPLQFEELVKRGELIDEERAKS